MHSDTGQNSNTTPQTPSQNPSSQTINPKVAGTVEKINNLQSPEDLLGFLKTNPSLSVPDAPPAPTEPITPTFLDSTPVADAPTEAPSEAPVEESVETSQETAESSQESPTSSQDPSKPPSTAAENLVNLRKSLNEEKKKAKAIEEEKQKLAKKVEEYDTGAAVPEALKKKDEEIQRLSTYEKLHNLKGSEAYRKKIIEPLNQNHEKLKAVAKDYGIPEDVMGKAINLTNRAELNRFLANHFDEVGALEVKQIIGDIQKLHSEARAAEKEPEQALSAMQEEHNRVVQAQEMQRVEKLSTRTKDAWVRALDSVRKDGKAKELIMQEGNSEHNEKIVKVILDNASKEYGKVMRSLGENGIKDVPEEVAFVLAKSMLLAHASSLAIHSRDALHAEYNKVIKNVQRDALHDRPPIGAAGVSGNGAPPPKPVSKSPMDNANAILNKIGIPT